MAAGTFINGVSKVEPGTFVKFEACKEDVLAVAERGTVLIPLELNWGPVNEFVTIENGTPDGQYDKLGFSVYEDDVNGCMLYLREALKVATKVIFYRLAGGTAATNTSETTGLTITAKYVGTRGNDITVVLAANLVDGMDVEVYLGTTLVHSQEGAETIGDLEENDYVVFSGTGTAELVASAGLKLSSGTDTDATNTNITDFLDKAEIPTWNSVCFPYDDDDLQEALLSKITYFREGCGKRVTGVAPEFEADYEGIIGVKNGVVLTDGTVIDECIACAWVAAKDASAENYESNTYHVYDGADSVYNSLNTEEREEAILAGLFAFALVNNEVVALYDINTLLTYGDTKSSDYRKNRVRRVMDTLDETLQLNFPPNKFDNSTTGWDLMESLGNQILLAFSNDGAISDVDYDTDFLVDRTTSDGDETFINVAIKPVDSAEKLYFTVQTS